MKIVILDDSMTIRIMLESLLEDIGVKEDEIFSFESGSAAIDFIKNNRSDIVFSDINMPDMDGYEFATSIFKIAPSLKNKFFTISGDENRETYARMKNIGGHRFLKKPINSEHFNHFIEPIIEKCRIFEAARKSKSMKVVILDDSMTIRTMIESLLEDLSVEENEIFSFDNGFAAIDFIKREGADLVFSDINMPDMDGYEFATLIFQIYPSLKNKFFTISGDENREAFARMKNIGGHRFLKKPINAEHFNHFIGPIVKKCRVSNKS